MDERIRNVSKIYIFLYVRKVDKTHEDSVHFVSKVQKEN